MSTMLASARLVIRLRCPPYHFPPRATSLTCLIACDSAPGPLILKYLWRVSALYRYRYFCKHCIHTFQSKFTISLFKCTGFVQASKSYDVTKDLTRGKKGRTNSTSKATLLTCVATMFPQPEREPKSFLLMYIQCSSKKVQAQKRQKAFSHRKSIGRQQELKR